MTLQNNALAITGKRTKKNCVRFVYKGDLIFEILPLSHASKADVVKANIRHLDDQMLFMLML